jgi:hypothetical protein
MKRAGRSVIVVRKGLEAGDSNRASRSKCTDKAQWRAPVWQFPNKNSIQVGIREDEVGRA